MAQKRLGTRNERQQRYYARHRAERLEYLRHYRAVHPEKWIESVARRKARKMAAFVEDVSRLVVFERDAGICGECGRSADPQDWHLDHIQPLSRGGEHSYANTRVTHPLCNRQKGNR